MSHRYNRTSPFTPSGKCEFCSEKCVNKVEIKFDGINGIVCRDCVELFKLSRLYDCADQMLVILENYNCSYGDKLRQRFNLISMDDTSHIHKLRELIRDTADKIIEVSLNVQM